MTEIPKIILPHGGYKKLIVFKKSDVIYQGTVTFCRRFLSKYGDRTVDQMIQAARSCKQNIAEGSAASGTSKETEIKLTNVARATLDELEEDYLDWLKSHKLRQWPSTDKKTTAAREFAKQHEDWTDWEHIFESRPAETLCNLQITLIHQTRVLLDALLKRQEEDFKACGGIRERMYAARTATRGSAWKAPLYNRMAGAESSEELSALVRELHNTVDRIAHTLRNRNGWDL
ncbi:MAG: four helix bundle suffix domain-containing protein [Planctomycetia bacterium]|nr:four helix bundle suffix domain-containing protein [Planctomycetia bacterium]